ncbi:MAG: sugar ABC transporter permease [Desulfobacterales bacterium]|nr:MAG: sugar ABC transporter permease [Desulfobacterales bacterium]
MIKRKYMGYVLLAPTLSLLVFLSIIPFVYALILSVRQLDLKIPRMSGQFVGLDNYRYLMREDAEFWHSMGITVIFLIVVVGVEFFLGFGLAILLNREFWGKRSLVSLAVVPMMIAPVAVGLMWRVALNYELGIITYLIKSVGIPLKEALLGTTATALTTLMIIDIWQWTPFIFLIMLAGLHSLPKEPYEAAQVDGASRVQIFRLVTLPLLKPLIIIALLLRVIDAFKTFDQVYILTGGGPGNATDLVCMFAYRVNFKLWNLGYGASVVIVIFILILIVTALFYTLTQKKEREVV